MTNFEVLEAVVILVGFFAVLAGVIVSAALVLNQFAYWIESRYAQPPSQVVERVDSYCNVYPLRKRAPGLDSIRSRRGDAA